MLRNDGHWIGIHENGVVITSFEVWLPVLDVYNQLLIVLATYIHSMKSSVISILSVSSLSVLAF